MLTTHARGTCASSQSDDINKVEKRWKMRSASGIHLQAHASTPHVGAGEGNGRRKKGMLTASNQQRHNPVEAVPERI